jgi:predicted nuclease of predicted toxin-antitoxin system
MKFLLDAQLPPSLAIRLRSFGHEYLHTRELPLGNRTPDSTINDLSLKDRLVVVTKDADFVNSFLLHKSPYKLLLISAGNISNDELEALLARHFPALVAALTDSHFVELDRENLIIHK